MALADHDIDRTSPVPLYHQLERLLRREIEAGRYRPGDPLPSEGEICQRYDVSRSVVRQTLANLASAGIVRTERGRGTFVAERKLHERFVQRTTGFYDDLTRMGLDIRTRVLRQEVTELPLRVQEFLGVARGVRIDRVRSVEGRVLVYVTTYLRADRCPGLEHDRLNDRSLYAHLEERYGLRVASGTRTVEAVAAEGEVARHLEVDDGTPLLLLRSQSCAENDQPLEWFEAWHRADRTMFEIEIVPGQSAWDVHGVLVDHETHLNPRGRPVTPRPGGHRWDRLVADAPPQGGKIVAVVRAPRYGDPKAIAEGLRNGGIGVVEFTLTGENALEAISAAADIDGLVVGAGSVFDAASARRAVAAGARFLIAPIAARDLAVEGSDVPVILAGFTATELWEAWQLTGEPVKLFPASIGGPAYVRALRAPMPALPVMPSGGVDASNARVYLAAGAHALNVGGSLCPVEAVLAGDGATLTRNATSLCAALDDEG